LAFPDKRRTQAESVQEQDAKEDVWADNKVSISPSQEIRTLPTYWPQKSLKKGPINSHNHIK